MTENVPRVLYAHRCHWCGKPVFKESISLPIIEDITILCSECLDWDKDGHVTINLITNKPVFKGR